MLSAAMLAILALATPGPAHDPATATTAAVGAVDPPAVQRECPRSLPASPEAAFRAVQACERAGLHGPPSERAAALLATARLLGVVVDGRRARVLEKRPELFHYDEPSGSWFYDGRHYEFVLRKHPGAPEADDAAWELASLPRGGECEGMIDCYLAVGIAPFERYSTRRPAGRHLSDAARTAADGLEKTGRYFDKEPQARARDSFDPKAIAAVLRRYEVAAQHFEGPARAEVLRGIAGWWGRLRQPKRAARLTEEANRLSAPR